MDHEAIQQASELMRNYRRKRFLALSPEERLEAMRKFHAEAFATLESNPEALQRFIKRNHHNRRAENAKRLELELLKGRHGDDLSTD